MFLSNKSPKGVVMEVCTERKITCSWMTSSEQLVPPIFKGVCTVQTAEGEELKAEGFGSSKKDAEKCAAFRMIPKLMGADELIQLTSDYQNTIAEEKRVLSTVEKRASVKAAIGVDLDGVSDTDDDEARPQDIGELNTLLDHCKLPTAEYKEGPQKLGPNNSRIFTITASVGDICTQSGRRTRKQDAKKIAAFRVLRDLKEKGYRLKQKKAPSTPAPSSGNVSSEVSSTQSPEEQSKYSNIVVEGATDGIPSSSKEAAAPEKRNIQALPPGPESAEENEEEKEAPLQMEIGDQDLGKQLKRKLEEEEEEPDVLSSSSSVSKRKYELLHGEKLTCFRQLANCIRFVKDFGHIFQHLPSNRNLDEALEPKEFHSFLVPYGGALKLLEKSAEKLNATLKFSKSLLLLNTHSTVVLLVLEFKNIQEFQEQLQKRHTFSGVGESFDDAKEDAALNALKYLRQMMFIDFE